MPNWVFVEGQSYRLHIILDRFKLLSYMYVKVALLLIETKIMNPFTFFLKISYRSNYNT